MTILTVCTLTSFADARATNDRNKVKTWLKEINMKRANIHTSAAIILSAAILFTGCGANTGGTTEKLQIEPITDADENAVQTDTPTGNETEETEDKAVAAENSVTEENGASTDTTEETDITEQPETPADGTAVYKDVLSQYRDMVQHDFYKEFLDSDDYESHFGKDIGIEIRAHRQGIFYALYDIDGNGTEELIIAGEEGDIGVSNPAFAPWNYDLYSYDGSKVVSVFPEMEFGYRTNFSLYDNGVIGVSYSGSAAESGTDFYKIGSDGITPELLDSFSVVWQLEGEEPKASYYQKDKEITEEAYKDCLQDYETPLPEELSWQEIY